MKNKLVQYIISPNNNGFLRSWDKYVQRMSWVGRCSGWLWKPKHRMRALSLWKESKGVAGESGGKCRTGDQGWARRQKSEFSKPSPELEREVRILSY